MCKHMCSLAYATGTIGSPKHYLHTLYVTIRKQIGHNALEPTSTNLKQHIVRPQGAREGTVIEVGVVCL